ncbi:AI-2E family transporter [Fictibacillus phosphorivorans]|uniref:AI-2E family transporter n=1 Tax=Fictibacillus phosphorivorans TaxID=1221500 RepID=UPI00203C9A17|nr:AI-2E family transporter [Fictibacillus phosphorivorans]MCM3719284.1 AI-2E family transporter [Fictibacillus phosphorivorans]MCM3776906.1 AI-2E family transporter [Fictibacillus phosphorivorans]
MWYQHSFFKYGAGAVLVLTILYLLGKIDYLIDFLYLVISSVFFPLFIAGLLYYLLRPVIRFLIKKRVPKFLAIFLVMMGLILIFSGISSFAIPVVADQLTNITDDFPKKIGEATEKTGKMVTGQKKSFIDSTQVAKLATERLEKFTSTISKDVIALVTTLTNVALVLLVVPFILFYLLLDDKKFFNYFLRIVPRHMEHDVACILRDIDSTLSSYIKGQVLVALFVGVFMYAGYMFIGLKFALVLALFAVVTNVIPFLGPFIGVFPALLIGLIQDPMMAVKVAVVTLVVQQVEGNILSPQIMGKQLHIHPLTIILIVLMAGAAFGFIGLLLAIPTYAVIKTLISNLYRIYLLYNPPETRSDLL